MLLMYSILVGNNGRLILLRGIFFLHRGNDIVSSYISHIFTRKDYFPNKYGNLLVKRTLVLVISPEFLRCKE